MIEKEQSVKHFDFGSYSGGSNAAKKAPVF